MATHGDIEADLTLEIDGGAVALDKFQRGVRAFYDLLHAVTRAVHAGDAAVRWTVQVKKGSNLVGVAPTPPEAGTAVIDALAAGVLLLEDTPRQPDRFSETALRGLRNLSRVVGTTTGDDTRVRLWVRKEPLSVTPRSAVHIAELLQGAYEDYGSVEGKLQTVSERGALRVIVYEPVWDRAVSCYLPEGLMPEAVNAFGQRVEVYGAVRYRADGVPISITVDDIVSFPPAGDLPGFRSVHGILRGVR